MLAEFRQMKCHLAEVCVAPEAKISLSEFPFTSWSSLELPGAGKNSWGPGWDLEGTNCWQTARVGRVLERWSPRPGGTDKRALSVAVPHWSLVLLWSPTQRLARICHVPLAPRVQAFFSTSVVGARRGQGRGKGAVP